MEGRYLEYDELVQRFPGMKPTSFNVEPSMSTISSAALTAIEHQILREFVNQAVDPEYAANYILQKIKDHSHSPVEEVLRDLKCEWKELALKFTRADPVPYHLQELVRERDGPYCSLSSRSGGDGCATRAAHAEAA
ncbi:hypothetical protein BJX64DRAFT_283028 [Aspergillus heterothallicus]